MPTSKPRRKRDVTRPILPTRAVRMRRHRRPRVAASARPGDRRGHRGIDRVGPGRQRGRKIQDSDRRAERGSLPGRAGLGHASPSPRTMVSARAPALQGSPPFRPFRSLRKSFAPTRRGGLDPVLDPDRRDPRYPGCETNPLPKTRAGLAAPDRATATTTTGGASRRRSRSTTLRTGRQDPPAAPRPGVHPAVPAGLRGGGDLAGRPLGRRPPGRGRRLGPPGAGDAPGASPTAGSCRSPWSPGSSAGRRSTAATGGSARRSSGGWRSRACSWRSRWSA